MDEHEPPPDRPAARGGLPPNRVEALSDGVFAIAMTLLVLELHVPSAEQVGSRTLAATLASLWPKIASYGVTFVNIGTLWIGHHFQFHYIRRADRGLLWLGLFYLMFVSFLPFAAGVLGSFPDEPAAAALYGATLLCAGAALWGHWEYATRGRRHVDAALPDEVVSGLRRRIAFGMAVYATAFALAFVAVRASLALYLLMPVLYILPGRADRHAEATTRR